MSDPLKGQRYASDNQNDPGRPKIPVLPIAAQAAEPSALRRRAAPGSAGPQLPGHLCSIGIRPSALPGRIPAGHAAPGLTNGHQAITRYPREPPSGHPSLPRVPTKASLQSLLVKPFFKIAKKTHPAESREGIQLLKYKLARLRQLCIQ